MKKFCNSFSTIIHSFRVVFLSAIVFLSLSTKSQVNLDFEATPTGTYTGPNSVSGWSISSQSATSCATSTVWAPGSPDFAILFAPMLNGFPFSAFVPYNILTFSPLGGFNVARLNDEVPSGLRTRMRQTFTVTSQNVLFEYAFAGMWGDGSHLCCEQAGVKINFYDCSGNPLPLVPQNYSANGSSCTNGAPGFSTTSGWLTNDWTWTGWQRNWVDLSPYIGSCVTIEVTSSDCIFGTHAGMTYFDCKAWAGLQGIPIVNGQPNTGFSLAANFCPGASQAQISAPLGYTGYQWYAPASNGAPIPISSLNGGNTPLVTINSPTAGVVYTVQLTASNGYTTYAVDTLQYSTVTIDGVGTTSTCPMGASGSASVLASGSGAGYNYTWTNSGNTVVSTSSVAANLVPGIYSVTVTANGLPGCGVSTGTVQVGTGPQNIYTMFKPVCGGSQIITASPGTNYQWYNGTASVTAAMGGTASALSISPSSGQSFHVGYTSPQGCRDSINYMFIQPTGSGSVSATNISYACPSTSNASANISLSPTPGFPSSANSFSIFSTSGPSYSASVLGIPGTSLSATNLSAGIYSIVASDGNCQYTSTFTVNNYVYNYSVNNPTVCLGNQAYLGVSFSTAIVPGQYSFTWSPVAWITGGALNQNNISISPIPAVTSTIGTQIFTVTVNPTVVNCPITRTVSVTSLTLPTPVITSIPSTFCNNATTQTILASPAGGTFLPGSGTWLNGNTGVITPSLASIGVNTFSYNLGGGQCITTASGTFAVSKFNTAAITTPTLSLCNNVTNCLNLLTITQNTNGVWSGNGVSANAFCSNNISAGQYNLTYLNTSTPNATLCPSTQTMNITLISSAIQGITTPQPFCNTASPFILTVTSAGGIWSSLIPGLVSPAGNVNPGLVPGGIVTLTYTGLCGNTATVNLSTSVFNSATLSNYINDVCVGAPNINLMSIVGSTVNGTWAGPGIINNYFTPSAAGVFPIAYNTTSSHPPLCPDQSSLTITVHALPIINIQHKGNICVGESAQLGLSGASTYSLNGAMLDSLYLSPLVSTNYTVTGQSFGCISKKTFTVNVSPCTGIEELGEGGDFLKTYPTPVTDVLVLELRSAARISLYNELGSLIQSDNYSSGIHHLALANLRNGMYLLKAEQSSHTRLIKVVIAR